MKELYLAVSPEGDFLIFFEKPTRYKDSADFWAVRYKSVRKHDANIFGMKIDKKILNQELQNRTYSDEPVKISLWKSSMY